MKPALTYQPDLFSAPVLDIKEGARLRDMGIKRAEDSAERKEPGWNEKTYQMFKDWLKGWPIGYQFRFEQFRMSAEVKGLTFPGSKRVIGNLPKKAKKDNLIKSVGLTKTEGKDAHGCFATLWQKL